MAIRDAASLPKGLGELFGLGTTIGVDEGHLIERFVTANDASAFEAIVARHGPMVWGVCRRSLRDPNDAEDAFQATFLILARRAGSIRDRGRLGGWLHGVACRVADRARREASRRPTARADGVASADPDGAEALDRRELADRLHREIDRLPEGCTHEEAAERLGCPVGTVRGRLSRGRERLRDRLSRRGMASAALPPLGVMHVPAALTASTTKAATAVAAGKLATGLASARAVAWLEGVSRAMMTCKLKAIAVKFAVAALAVTTGAGVFALSRGDGEADPPAPRPAAAPAPGPASPPAASARLPRAQDWGGGGQGYELGRDEAEKHSGKSSGCVRSGDAPGPFGTLTQGFRADAYRGKRLRMSAQVKADGVERSAGLWMRVDGKEQTALAFDNMGERPIKGSADWKKVEVVLDVPDAAEEIYFGFLLSGKGRAWVDDIAFEAVGKEVASTGMEVQPMLREGGLTPGLPAVPKNLGFER